ncbi:unnamed protein product [Malus baccata var. baccata]
MDEPSSGLDPASRKHLRNILVCISSALSMEEAEYICDRLGIVTDGTLQCIGNPNPKEARYGGSYALAITTTWDHEQKVEDMVQTLCSNSNKVYQLSGTQKFELPKSEWRMQRVRSQFLHGVWLILLWRMFLSRLQVDPTLESIQRFKA